MPTLRRISSLFGTAIAGASLVLVAGSSVAQPTAAKDVAPRSGRADIPTLQTQKTEEGQTVIYDQYTWQRRELTKRLPLEETWPADDKIDVAFKRFNLDKSPVPAALPLPSRIMTDVYLVNAQPNLTYLIDAGADGLVLVDPGMLITVQGLLKNIEKLGFSPSQIKWVINTHAHFDHSQADGVFQKLGAKILVGRDDVPAVEKATFVTGRYALPPAMSGGEYPRTHVDWPVDDGEEIKLGNKTFVAIHTPGHTPGSTCYMLTIDGKNILFGGDTILFDYRLAAQPMPYIDPPAYLASLRKLAVYGLWPNKVRWDVLLPGHGTMVMDRAYADVLKGYRQVELDQVHNAQVQALPFATDDYRKIMFGRP